MFVKLSTLAVALALPLVSALSINPLTGATTAGEVTITWTASTTDAPYFSILLVNSVFHDTFAIANNVQTSLGSITIGLPQVPVTDGYTLEAIATNNVNTIYSQSGTFAVGSTTTSSATGASTTSTPVTTDTAATSISSGTVSTPSVIATTPVASVSSVTTAGTSSAASSTPSTFSSSGAASFKLAGIAPAAALVLSVVAGTAMVF